MAISSNDIRIRYVIDTSELNKAQSSWDKLTKEEQDALSALKKFNTELDNTGKEAADAGKKLDNAFSKSSGGISDMLKGLGPLGPAIAGAFSVGAVVAFAKSVIDVTSNFEKLEAVLKNTLGGGAPAYQALENIKEFAKTTPFSVQELTDSFVKLANQGFTPNIDQMRKLGDLASSTGKNFDQLAEAIIDAQVGEFERLKEFGVRASKQGDMVTFSFKGVETQTKFTNEAIREYITSLGDYNGVAGASEAISQTLGGQINNLGDAWDSFLNQIGTLLGPVLKGALNVTANFMNDINKLFKLVGNDIDDFKDRETNAFKNVSNKSSQYTDAELENSKKYTQERIKQLQAQIKAEEDAAEGTRKRFGLITGSILNFAGQTGKKLLYGDQLKSLKEDLAVAQGMLTGYTQEEKTRAENASKTQKQIADAQAGTAKAAEELAKKNKKASDDAAKAAAEALRAEKERYQQQLNQLQLDKEIESLSAELRGSPEGKLAAEQRYQEGVYQLKLKYQNKGIGISEKEVEVAKLTAERSLKAYEEAYEKLKLKPLDAVKKFQNEVADSQKKAEEKMYQDRLAQMKKWQADYEEGLKKEAEAREKTEKDKQNKIQASFELGQTLVNGGFNLYQANINREMESLNKRYAEEVRLAGGNQQKIDELNAQKAEKEKELKEKAWKAERTAAVARVIFETASLVAKWASNPVTAGLAALTLANQAAQIGFIFAQKMPEFAEGTKGKPFEGGMAMVGERGVEKVVTKSGKVYFTPDKASLVNLPEGSQVVPNHMLTTQERFLAGQLLSGRSSSGNPMAGQLSEIGNILKNLPITQLNMDEKGFEKFIRTPRRTTKVLNNRFRSSQLV